MASKVENIVKDAIKQGWRKTPGAKHWKLWEPSGRRYQTVPFNYYSDGNYRAEKNFLSDMRKMGYRPSEEVASEQATKTKEAGMTSVQELIKANGVGKPTEPELPKIPPKKRTRQSRTGLDKEILRVLKAVFPNEMDFTTLKMKVSLNHPGVSASVIHNYMSVLKKTGEVVSIRQGYARAANADPVAEVSTPTMSAVREAIALPTDLRKVIDDLLNATAAAEKLIIALDRRIKESDEAAETIKRMAARL